MKYEGKIIGINPLWISVLVIGTFLVVCVTGGTNVNWSYLGFEVIFPFYMAVMIGEWCKIRTDPVFDLISAQGKSLFGWIVHRFATLFAGMCLMIFIGLLLFSFISEGVSFFDIIDIIFTFLSTSFFLSSICVFISIFCDVPHIPTMIVAVFWLFSFMIMSLLRFKPIQYFYLFPRYAGISDSVWIINKIILMFIGAVLWLSIFVVCKKRICCM